MDPFKEDSFLFPLVTDEEVRDIPDVGRIQCAVGALTVEQASWQGAQVTPRD